MSVFVVVPALPALIDRHIQPRHFCSSECQGWGLHWQCSWCSGYVPAVWRGSGRQISCVCPHDVASQLSLFKVQFLHACVCILPTLVTVCLERDVITTNPCLTLPSLPPNFIVLSLLAYLCHPLSSLLTLPSPPSPQLYHSIPTPYATTTTIT